MTLPRGRIGFTGTHGMAPRQRKAVRQLLYHVNVLHLGDCVGADAEAYEEAILLGIATIGHPPSDGKMRAFLDYNEERPARPYLVRNELIVAEGVDGLIAAPKGWVEEQRSGTWATVRAARKSHRHIWIVLPDGKIIVRQPARPVASICYVDHVTGDSDHMNAHIRTQECG